MTKITDAMGHISKFSYGYADGQLTSATDPNSQITTYKYNIQPSGCGFQDEFDRLGETDNPDGGITTNCYNDSPYNPSAPSPSVTITKAITSGLNEVSTTAYDGIGHAIETILSSDPDNTTYTVTSYDGIGKPYQVYNPTRCSTPTTNCGTETTWGYATNTYDALGRSTQVAEPDGSTSSTSYSQNTTGFLTTVTDEIGNQRKSQTDGLGRLTYVWEAPSVSGYNYETDYGYDPLSNLLSVNQKGGSGSSQWRQRSFVYDSLPRLTSATNPESGTISYGYDANGNIATKTAPSPNQAPTGTATVTTSYTYDPLNRNIAKAYNDAYGSNSPTLGASYAYDGNTLTGCNTAPPALADSYPVPRRTSMCDGSGATSWAHDNMGRVLKERRTISTISGDYENDTFNLDGSVSSVTSLGYKVTYTYGGAARPLTAMNSTKNIVTSASYAPPGELASMTLGSAGIMVSDAYNDRLQPILLSAGVTGQNPFFSECFDFHLGVPVTVPSPCSFSAPKTGDNGNVYQIVNNRYNTRSQNFIYDSLNRIQQAYSSGTQWGETFSPTATNPGVAPTTPGIDPWGNLTNRSGVTGKSNYEQLSVSAGTNNQLSGSGYDPARNMTSQGSAAYVYDDENRLIATAGYSYLYDGDGERVEKCTEGTTPGTCATSATGTLYWRGLGSDPMAETDLAGNVKNNYIFFNGQRVARNDSAGAIHYYFSDHLGSHGVVENATGTACEQDIDYYPYGGEEYDYATQCGTEVPQNYKFTGKERDGESGLDMFGARYYASSMGRFMIPDWAAKPTNVPYASFGNPQSLNLYSYVNNNPTTLRDPDGHCGEDLCIVEGGAAIYVGGAALLAGTAAVLSTPSGQRSLSTFTSAAGQSISNSISAISSFFHPNNSGQNAPPPATTPTNVSTGTPASTSQQGAVNTSPMPLIVVSPGGDAIPVPNGASGPVPVVNNAGNTTGFGYTGGSGGNGLSDNTTGVRVMDPTPARGASPGYPNGYVSYGNSSGQTVNGQTGQTVPRSDPSAHVPLSSPKPCPSGGSC